MFSVDNIKLQAAFVLFLIVTYLYRYKRTSSSTPLPPGPTPLPLIGNRRQLPREKSWKTYGEWAKQYGKQRGSVPLLVCRMTYQSAGEIVHVTNWGKHIIVLNSFQAVYELLERKSTIYSSRPQTIMFHRLQVSPLQLKHHMQLISLQYEFQHTHHIPSIRQYVEKASDSLHEADASRSNRAVPTYTKACNPTSSGVFI